MEAGHFGTTSIHQTCFSPQLCPGTPGGCGFLPSASGSSLGKLDGIPTERESQPELKGFGEQGPQQKDPTGSR